MDLRLVDIYMQRQILHIMNLFRCDFDEGVLDTRNLFLNVQNFFAVL
jgi:hypothetical protein